MPVCGSQMPLCDVPIRFDTYKGCTHACEYCFVKRLSDIKQVSMGESIQSLKSFISGKRTKTTSWCDWDIPIHWGGESDPFQPCEKLYHRSYEALKVFAATGYPFIVSTKSTLPVQKEYLDLFKRCNCVFQASMVCSKYDAYEKGAPTFEERKKMLAIMAPNVKRVVVRAQPYLLEVEKDVKEQIKKYADIGVYGIVFEGMKYRTKRQNTEKWYGDNVLKKSMLKRSFEILMEECHKCGIVFLCGENRLRSMGDSLTCCGCEGLEGFKVNTFNQNSFNCGRTYTVSDAQKKAGTASGFITMCEGMEHKYGLALEKMSFAEAMNRHYNAHPDLVR